MPREQKPPIGRCLGMITWKWMTNVTIIVGLPKSSTIFLSLPLIPKATPKWSVNLLLETVDSHSFDLFQRRPFPPPKMTVIYGCLKSSALSLRLIPRATPRWIGQSLILDSFVVVPSKLERRTCFLIPLSFGVHDFYINSWKSLS